MVSVIFVVVSTIAMVINTLPDLAGPPDEKVIISQLAQRSSS